MAALALLVACDEIGGGGNGSARAATPSSDRQASSASSADEDSEGARLYRRACIMCHGEGGRGTQLGPSLADAEWRRARGGTPDQIAAVVRGGVPDPDDFPVPMPPRGDGTYDDQEVAAVAAYVQSLSR